MSVDSKKQDLSKLISQLYGFYTIKTLILFAALFLAVVPERPFFLQHLDDQIFALTANEEQQRLAVNEQKLQDERSFYEINLEDIAGSLGSIVTGDIFRSSDTRETLTPSWFFLAERLALLLLAGLLITRLNGASGRTSSYLILGTASSLLLLQMGLLRFSNLWLPLGITAQYLAMAYMVVLFQLRFERECDTLRLALHKVSLAHGKLLQEQGVSEGVLETIEQCLPTEETQTLTYTFAREQEKRRQFESAISAYSLLSKQNRRFKDVQQRLSDLRAAEQRRAKIAQQQTHQPMALEATMIVSTSIEMPHLGRYKVERELGRGAMGTVYLGKDPKIAREVAIKTLSYKQFEGPQLDELRERFFREAKAAGRLNHPNIVTVYDVGEEQDLAYIAMDYIEGSSLDAYCRPDRLLPVETVYQIILKVAEALSYAHKQKIVHRDIKPSNLIYNAQQQQVKVSDFGIARISDESKTRTGHVMGSPIYMSPEQLKGRAVTGTADIFSLGATFYQLLTGATPFTADNLPELTIKIMSSKQKSVRDIRSSLPASAVRITNKALNKDPDKRFANAEEMAEQIRKALVNDFKAKVA